MKREYTLTIKAQGLQKETTSPIASPNGGSGTQEESSGLLSKDGAKAFMKGFAAYKTVKSFVTQAVNYEVSIVSLQTGSQELQQKAEFINSVVQQGVGILETVGAGALVGGLPGALIGLTLGTMHTVIGYAQKANTLNLQNALEVQSIERNYIRAGALGSRQL